METNSSAQKFRHVGKQRGAFGGEPQTKVHRTGKVRAAILRQGFSGRNPQLGRKILDQDRHGVRPQQHPEQRVSEPAAKFPGSM